MAAYKVTALVTVECSWILEAPNKQEAYGLAEESFSSSSLTDGEVQGVEVTDVEREGGRDEDE